MNSLNTRSLRDEADQYLHNLLNFLKANQRNPGVTVVALEIAHHYAAATSLLLEQGLIDQVLFTEYNRGSLLEVDELGKFRKDTLFFAGGYNGRCLKVSIDEMREVRDLDKSTFLSEEILKRIKERFPSQAEGKPGSIWAIRDLIINSPNDYQTLSPRRVIGSSPERTIPLEEMMRRVSITA